MMGTQIINLFHATSFSITPENIRKALIFCWIQGVWKETSGMKWVNVLILIYYVYHVVYTFVCARKTTPVANDVFFQVATDV